MKQASSKIVCTFSVNHYYTPKPCFQVMPSILLRSPPLTASEKELVLPIRQRPDDRLPSALPKSKKPAGRRASCTLYQRLMGIPSAPRLPVGGLRAAPERWRRASCAPYLPFGRRVRTIDSHQPCQKARSPPGGGLLGYFLAADGSRTHVSSLEGWGNSRYTTAAYGIECEGKIAERRELVKKKTGG